MALRLSSCGSDPKTPEGATEGLLKDLQKGDVIVWQEEISGQKLSEKDKKELEKQFKKAPDEIFEHMKDFDFKILDSKETKKGKEADVKVEFTTYDFVKVTEAVQKYFSMNHEKLAKMKKDEFQEELNKVMKKQFDKSKKDVKNKATLRTKFDNKNKEWKVVDLGKNFDFQNAISGGRLKHQIQQAQKLQENN